MASFLEPRINFFGLSDTSYPYNFLWEIFFVRLSVTFFTIFGPFFSNNELHINLNRRNLEFVFNYLLNLFFWSLEFFSTVEFRNLKNTNFSSWTGKKRRKFSWRFRLKSSDFFRFRFFPAEPENRISIPVDKCHLVTIMANLQSHFFTKRGRSRAKEILSRTYSVVNEVNHKSPHIVHYTKKILETAPPTTITSTLSCRTFYGRKETVI